MAPGQVDLAYTQLKKTYTEYGELLESGGQVADAITYHRLCLTAAEHTSDKTAEAKAHYRLGRALVVVLSDAPGTPGAAHAAEGKSHLSRSLALCTELGDIRGQGMAYSSLAALSQKQQQQLQQQQQSRGGSGAGGGAGSSAAGGGGAAAAAAVRSRGGGGGGGDDEDDEDEALGHLKNFLRVSESTGNLEAQAEACHNLGAIYNRAGRFDRAVEFLEQNFRLCRQLVKEQGAKTAIVDKARVNLGMAKGNQRLGRYMNVVLSDLKSLLYWKNSRQDVR